MSTQKTIGPLSAALVLAAAVVQAGVVWANEPTADELMRQIAQLQRQVARIQARDAAASEIAAARAQIEADARYRSQMLQAGGVQAGWDGAGFFISSTDGRFVFKPLVHFQLRNVTNFRMDVEDDGDDWHNGFEMRRMKFGARGNIFDQRLAYQFIYGANRNGGNVCLDEAWVRYQFADGYFIRSGQFKTPLNRESLIGTHQLLATERSYQVEVLFGADNFTQGVSLIFDDADSPVRAEVAFTDGSMSSNGNFQDPPAGTDQDFGVAGRIDYKAFGDWKAVNDFCAARVATDTLVVGAGVDYTEGAQPDAGTRQVIRYTADGLYKHARNWSLYAAFNGRHTSIKDGDQGNDWGLLAQVAWSPDDKIEPFLRYGYTYFDTLPTGDPAVHEITLGTNCYFYAQHAKLTFDVSYFPNGAPFACTGADILASEGAQVVVRAQFQLAL